MIRDRTGAPGRRFASGRPFLIAGLLTLSALTAAAAQTQDGLNPHITGRQARLAREAGGGYRVVEVLQVRLVGASAAISTLTEPLLLLVLPEQAGAVSGLGGDLAPEQVMEYESHISVLGNLPSASFEFAVTYTLPVEAVQVDFAARAATDSLVLFIDRGSVEARPDPSLRPQGDIGTATQPRRQYTVRDVPAGTAISVALGSRRLTQRDRLAVLIATLLAASLAGGWVWRLTATAATAPETSRDSAVRAGG